MELHDIKQRIQSNYKFSAKLSWKRRNTLQAVQQIKEYFAERGFYLPKRITDFSNGAPVISERVKQEVRHEVTALKLEESLSHLADYAAYKVRFKDKAKSLEDFTAYRYKKELEIRLKVIRDRMRREMIDKETRFFTDEETGETFVDDYRELARMYYSLKKACPGVYDIFQKRTPGTLHSVYDSQLACAYYTKHRLDEVWNWRKSQILRTMWRSFLQATNVHEEYQPLHLTLTVPHKGGVWKGKRFYMRELINAFNILRKYPEWNKYIHGGEYGGETTRKSEDNGMHCHLHCLVFQRKEYSVNEVRAWIAKKWNELTGSKICWYETLYIHRKDDKGNWILQLDENGKPQLNRKTGKPLHKKFYLDDNEPWFQWETRQNPEARLNLFTKGVLECIKYHFKTDCFKTPNNDWDIDLIKEVLNNSKGLRMYSKFGAFYKEERLNFKQIEDNGETEAIVPEVNEDGEVIQDPEQENIDQDLNGNVDNVQVINPFTLQMAEPGSFFRVLALPENFKHGKKDVHYKPEVSNKDHSMFYEVRRDVSLKEIVQGIARGRYQDVLSWEDFERFKYKLLKDIEVTV
jgi:hypothetical protein